MTRIALVTPWFGEELRGGAEQQSWQLAHHLARRGHAVDVLTTTSASFNDDWSRSAHAPGLERTPLLGIRRFRVGARKRRAFNRVNARLTALYPADLHAGLSPIDADAENTFCENSINSPALLEYLRDAGDAYDRFIFIPYLYGTTLQGVPLVAERAYVQPCLHDESYAYLGVVQRVFHAARGLLFNSEGERNLARQLLGPGIAHKSWIVGEGVEEGPPAESYPSAVGGFVPANERYVLYIGRQLPGKNLGLLRGAFSEFRRQRFGSELKLVFAGERATSASDAALGIVDLGPVSDSAKAALLAHCQALVQPSTNESFSRVIFEAWLHGRPVVAHGDCPATAMSVTASNGGLLATGVASWQQALETIDAGGAELRAMGERGKAYAHGHASWPTVIDRYDAIFDAERAARAHFAVGDRLDQVVPPDAPQVRAYALALASALRGIGIASAVLDAGTSEGLAAAYVAHVANAGASERDALAAENPAATIFHDASSAAGNLAQATLRDRAAFGATAGALAALREAGVAAEFLPVCVDPADFDCQPDRPLMATLADGKMNVVYVGSLEDAAPLETLLRATSHAVGFQRRLRLVIASNGTFDEGVTRATAETMRRLRLVEHALLVKHLEREQTVALYRSAGLFLTLDDVDGYGRDLIEAMWFDVPIVAYRSPTASIIAGDASIFVTSTDDVAAIGALANIVLTDARVSAAIVERQRALRSRFEPSVLARELATRALAGVAAL